MCNNFSQIIQNYREDDGPMEMSRISAFIIGLLSQEKTRKELITLVYARYRRADARREVKEVTNALRKLKLLSV